ncbi:MAG: fused MFS/spermidine synthase [Deltaproteobacteria bacterium]|jgi:spermidine synthase|nr:fused MFS/spermidine synthase [Deltaproteobacteria bacterium]
MNQSEISGEGVPSRHFALLLLFFVASGCAALIYEVVWFHLLRLVVGASAVSLAIVLTSYMGGMCIGSLAFPRWVSPNYSPLRVYAYLEAAIAVLGILLLALLPLIGKLYLAFVGHGAPGLVLRAVVCLLCLLPPTILMGATLPAIARCLNTTRSGISRLGLLYMANLAGGVFGCLLAGFYLLRLYDGTVATWFAVSLNAGVAALAYAIAPRDGSRAREAPQLALPSLADHRIVYLVIGLSGLTALGAQVIWTRLLGLILGGTVFSFTIILAIFLTGLGLGSSVGSLVARHVASPRAALGWCQLALVFAIPLAAHMITAELPYWKLNPDFADSLFRVFSHDLVQSAVAILPATVLWGASFPLALAAAAGKGQEPGHLAGGINAANTIGAIAGALLFGLVMVPAFGSSVSQQVLAVLAGGSALLLLGAPRGVGSRGAIELPRAIAATALIAALAILMIQLVPPVSGRVIAVGRRAYDSAIVLESILFAGEGRTSSVAVVDYPSTNSRSIHVGGKVMASTVAEDMRLQRMMGHLPVLMHPNPKTALVIGFGAGVTAGSLVVHPEIERIVICDFEPLMPEIGGRYFAKENYNVIDDPRVEVVVDDARHYIATTREKFDIITSDPLDPWMDGAAVLYTVEFYEYARERLNPGGIVAQWLPLYETDGPSMKSELASFLEVFPDGTVWSSHIPRNGGNDLVMMGSDGPMQVEVDRMASRIRQNPRLAQSLEDVDLGYLITLLATYFGRGSELADWLADAQINRERSLRLQYLAGFSLDVYEEREIYRAMAAHRRYPADILVASPEIEAQVRERWSQ